MKKVKLLTEDDRNEILNLYSQKNIVLEQTATQQNYTLQDIQNLLNRPPFNSKLNADNKFGPLTAGAIGTALDMIKSGQASNDLQTMQSKQITSIPTSTTTKLAAATTTTQPATTELKTPQTTGLVTPKTVKSEWCIQNTKREDEDCFSGKSMDYQTARAEANRTARAANYPYKRTETPKDQNPYYAIYATQPASEYEKNKAETNTTTQKSQQVTA